MIEAYFGLKKPPFTKEIRSEQMIETYDSREALARLSHIRQHRGLFCLTGEPGSGKTSVLRKFVDSLNPQTYLHCYTPHATVSRGDFYRQLNTLLNLPPKMRKSDLFDQIQRAVQDLYGRQGKIPTFIIDEVQLMDHETLQEISLITNFEMDSKMPFCLWLTGPRQDLLVPLRQAGLAEVRSRLQFCYHLKSLQEQETEPYLAAHLRWAGCDRALFPRDVALELFRLSNGLPRTLNRLAYHCLMAGALEGKDLVDKSCLERAVSEVLPAGLN